MYNIELSGGPMNGHVITLTEWASTIRVEYFDADNKPLVAWYGIVAPSGRRDGYVATWDKKFSGMAKKIESRLKGLRDERDDDSRDALPYYRYNSEFESNLTFDQLADYGSSLEGMLDNAGLRFK